MGKPTRSDVLLLGLPAQAAAAPSWRVGAVSADTGAFTLPSHGFDLDARVSLDVASPATPALGGTPATLPTGLAVGVTYYVRPLSDRAFLLAEAPTPADAITSYDSTGSGTIVVCSDPWAPLDRAIDDAWTTIQALLTAHGGDVEAPVVEVAARYLAAQHYVAHMCAGDPAKGENYSGIATMFERVYRPLLESWRHGVPVRGATDATPHVAEMGAVVRRRSSSATSYGVPEGVA
jgi:hypothetical protein